MQLTSEQDDLRDAVRSLIDRTSAAATPAASPAARQLWQRLCGEIGAAGLLIPERYGGAGAGLVEAAVVLAELGRAVAPSPMLGSAVLATAALLAAGDQTACERLLPGLADGSELAALAWTTAAGRWDPAEVACTAVQAPGHADWRISGDAHYVLDGDQATVLLVPARTEGGETGLFEVAPGQPGITRSPHVSVDESRGWRRCASTAQRAGGSAAPSPWPACGTQPASRSRPSRPAPPQVRWR